MVIEFSGNSQETEEPGFNNLYTLYIYMKWGCVPSSLLLSITMSVKEFKSLLIPEFKSNPNSCICHLTCADWGLGTANAQMAKQLPEAAGDRFQVYLCLCQLR